jgi:XTP/dITP diphosphohydrolase
VTDPHRTDARRERALTPGAGAGPLAVDHPGVSELVAVMDRLRSPGGCPWDAEQTHESLLPYAVEEVFEVVEAVETGDRTDLREELGDLLLQVVFHARLAQEHPDDPFDVDDVAAGVADKLRRRHPHVFGDAVVHDAGQVNRQWEEIKQTEKARASVLDGIPTALPALARAQKTVRRARRAGLRVPGGSGPGGDLLALVVAAEESGVDAEAALRAAVRELEHQLRAAEADLAQGRAQSPAEGVD